MARLRKVGGGYTLAPNTIFTCGSLSARAVGVYCLLLSLPDGWRFSARGLATLVTDGKAAVGAALRELEEAGFLEREICRGEDGVIEGVDYVVYEMPPAPSPRSAERARAARMAPPEPPEETDSDDGSEPGPASGKPQVATVDRKSVNGGNRRSRPLTENRSTVPTRPFEENRRSQPLTENRSTAYKVSETINKNNPPKPPLRNRPPHPGSPAADRTDGRTDGPSRDGGEGAPALPAGAAGPGTPESPNTGLGDADRGRPRVESEPGEITASERSTGASSTDAEERRAALERMRVSAVNRNLVGDPRVDAAFGALADAGLAPADIARAWDAHQRDLRRRGREERYFTQLLKWLLSPATPFDVRAAREGGGEDAAAPADAAEGPAGASFRLGRGSAGRECVFVVLPGRVLPRPSWPVAAGEGEWRRLWELEGGAA